MVPTPTLSLQLSTAFSSGDPLLTPLHMGAWLGKPTQVRQGRMRPVTVAGARTSGSRGTDEQSGRQRVLLHHQPAPEGGGAEGRMNGRPPG